MKLQEKPFQLLALLLERPGRLIKREEMRERLWEADTFVDFDQGLNTAVKKLRQTLNDSAGKPRYIETQPRRGYRFIAAVELVVPEGEAPPISLDEALPPDPGPGPPVATRAARLAKWWGVAAAIVLAAASSILYFTHPWGESAAGIESIAVLPLTNLSADAGQEYLVDGLTDALIGGLARIGTLRVISRTSVMQYKGTHKQIPEIARELRVDAVLEGTVLRSANRVRIATKLIRAATDRTLLAATYEGGLGDILALQNDVSSAIARKVAANVTTTARREPSTPAPSNAEAYEAYLKGRFFWDKRSLAGLTKAIQYFEEAIAKDPRSALAYAGLANCFNMLPFYGGSPPRVAFPKAKGPRCGLWSWTIVWRRVTRLWHSRACITIGIGREPNPSSAARSRSIPTTRRSGIGFLTTCWCGAGQRRSLGGREGIGSGPSQPQHQHPSRPSLLVHEKLRQGDCAAPADA